MDINEYGYLSVPSEYTNDGDPDSFETGRIVTEHRERYKVVTNNGEVEAEISGSLRFTASGREDFPAVGDWVRLSLFDSDFAVIQEILPRHSLLTRKAAGTRGEIQVIAANVDYGFLVQSANRDFNLNRLERYMSVCFSAGISPIIILTKTDLCDAVILQELINRIGTRLPHIPVIAVSSETGEGYSELASVFRKGMTYCMLGSSGVGKSTLLNKLSGRSLMKTDYVSDSTGKGKHVSTHRELILLQNGSILIDNPGMREVGITDSSEGLEITFDTITEMAGNCRFSDCSHVSEAGCAVIDAVESGMISRDAYENYLRMSRERSFFESSAAERKKKEKSFGRIMKNYKKDIRKNEQ